jgi:hypothetical protein
MDKRPLPTSACLLCGRVMPVKYIMQPSESHAPGCGIFALKRVEPKPAEKTVQQRTGKHVGAA